MRHESKEGLLGAVPPGALVRAREQAHLAAQVLAAVGETHASHQPDTSHTALAYRSDLQCLVSAPTLGGALRAALWIPTLTVGVLRGDEIRAQLPLHGRTLSEAMAWMQEQLSASSGAELSAALVRPDYELEAHSIGEGDAFDAEPDALAELDRWFANARGVLAQYAPAEDGRILCWPHHFDIAVLRVLASAPAVQSDGEPDREATKTVGIGLSPGDAALPEPYWYVNHWPAKSAADVAHLDLSIGGWHSDGFVAAILKGSELTSRGDVEAQASALDAFLREAVEQSERLLR